LKYIKKGFDPLTYYTMKKVAIITGASRGIGTIIPVTGAR